MHVMTRSDDDNARHHFKAGYALWAEGKPAQALTRFRAAHQALEPGVPWPFRLDVTSAYALALRENGEHEAAIALYRICQELCLSHGQDPRDVRRGWAIALESMRDFEGAFRMLDAARPDADAPWAERLKWSSAIGLTCWSAGQLAEAAHYLAEASAALPENPQEAAPFLAVLGNDADLSLRLGRSARAYRLVTRMVELRGAVDKVPMSAESSLFKVRAALARERGDHGRAMAILQKGVDWFARHDPDEWRHRLDLLSDFVDASRQAGVPEDAISFLQAACAEVPIEQAWIGGLMLSQMLIRRGDAAGSRIELEKVVAFLVGGGPPETEAEIVAGLAHLAQLMERPDATVFLGKMALKYLALLIHVLDAKDTYAAIAESEGVLELTRQALRRRGRFREAAELGRFFDRVRRFALVSRRPVADALAQQPVPMNAAERAMEDRWGAWRAELAKLRGAADATDVLTRAAALIDDLMAFETNETDEQRGAALPPPMRGVIRLGLVPGDDQCALHVRDSDRQRVVDLPLSSIDLFEATAALRDGVWNAEAWRRPAEQLYRHLIAPLEAELAHAECLELEADGVLGTIPFAMLWDGEGTLCRRLPIRYVLEVVPPAPSKIDRSGLVAFDAFSNRPFDRPKEAVWGSLGRVVQVGGPAFDRDAMVAHLAALPAHVTVLTHLAMEAGRPDLAAFDPGAGDPIYLSDFAQSSFDLNGVGAVMFAACSSGAGEDGPSARTSLAALVLEKGARSFVGTLWDVSQSAAAQVAAEFWTEMASGEDPDPVSVLARVQARMAEASQGDARAPTRSGGIGSAARATAPAGWAGFAVFKTCNPSQPGASTPRPRSDSPQVKQMETGTNGG